MTSLRSLSFLAFMVLAFLAQPIDVLVQAQDSKDNVPSMQEAAVGVQKILKLKADSYHVLLREASLLVPPGLQGQEWAEVQKLMLKNSFAAVEAWVNGDAVHSYHLLKSKAFAFPNGHSLDLYCLLSAPNLDRPKRPARPSRLNRADVALAADINAPYRQVVGEKRYAKGSVLDVILSSEKVREVGDAWPLLKKVHVHYGYIFNRWVEHNPSGFHVTLEFTVSVKEKVAGKDMYFHVASGLDPLQSWDGKEKLLRDFKSQDTLGGIVESGGNEWWQGAKEEVEANKRKYLKTKQ